MSDLDLQISRYLNFCVPFNGACLVAALVIVGLVYFLFLKPLLSPLSRLPGPKNESLLFGNLDVVYGPEGGLRQWHTEFGANLRFQGFFGHVQLSTIDPKAVNYILNSRAYSYPKPDAFRRNLGTVLGHGLIFAEGETHKRQKRLLGPTFSPVQIKELVPVVYESAYLLRDIWSTLIRSSQKPYLVIDVLPWLARATLDIIGSAGFGYQFGALKRGENSSEMGKAFSYLTLLSSKRRTPQKLLKAYIFQAIPPSLRFYEPAAIKLVNESLKTLERESSSLLSQKKKEAEAGGLGGKDLISVLVCANMMSEGKEFLRDEEVIAQMTTFLIAGHETTATSLTWLFWTLAKHPDIQKRLRDELQEASVAPSGVGEQIPFETLTSLKFLDAVCREILRFLPAVSQTARQATVADTIPVSGDGEPIRISAGEEIMIPISAFNLSKDIFGKDADVFRPDRWLDKGQVSSTLPGFWSGLLTFLGGPRACIGYRFSLMELKVLIAVIISDFHFEERDGLGCGPEFERQVGVVMRPQVKEEKRGLSMPLRVSLVKSP